LTAESRSAKRQSRAAIHAVSLSQAVKALGILGELSPASRAQILAWREIVPVFRQDTLTSAMLGAVADASRAVPRSSAPSSSRRLESDNSPAARASRPRPLAQPSFSCV
jgi:hypothetical protein